MRPNNTEYGDLSNNDDDDSVINYEVPARGDDVESSVGSAEEGDDGGTGVNEGSGVCVLPRQGDIESLSSDFTAATGSGSRTT